MDPDPLIDFGDGRWPPWLDLVALRSAFLAAGFTESTRGVQGSPHCVGMRRPLPPGQTTRHGDTSHFALVPLDRHHLDAAAVARRAILVLEEADGPHVEFGPLTAREVVLYAEIDRLRRLADQEPRA